MPGVARTLQVSCVQMHWAKPLERNLERTLFYIQRAAHEGSRVVLFPETSLTSCYLPYAVALPPKDIRQALDQTCRAAAEVGIWAIVGTIMKTADRFLNLAHVISPEGTIVHEYAKVHLVQGDEEKYCRGGNKLSLFEIDGVLCTIAICRDGRHPELYRIPAMAGTQVLFHPVCHYDEVETLTWKRVSGRSSQPVGPNSRIFHCVANTIGQSPDGKLISGGGSFIREPSGLPLTEASYYREEMITAVLDLDRADRRYALDSLERPHFLKSYWEAMIDDVKARANGNPDGRDSG